MIRGMARQDRLRRISQAHDRRRPGRPMRLWRKLAIWRSTPARDRGFWYGFAIDVLWPVLMAVARWDFRGGRQVPASGGALLAVNHLSHVDPIVLRLLRAWPRAACPRFLAMKELWGMTVVGAPLRGGPAHPRRPERLRHRGLPRGGRGGPAGRGRRRLPRGRLRRALRRLAPRGAHRRRAHGPRDRRAGDPGGPVGLQPPAAADREGRHARTRARRCACSPARPSPSTTCARAGSGAPPCSEATDRIMGRITEQLAVLRGEEPPTPPDGERPPWRRRRTPAWSRPPSAEDRNRRQNGTRAPARAAAARAPFVVSGDASGPSR